MTVSSISATKLSEQQRNARDRIISASSDQSLDVIDRVPH